MTYNLIGPISALATFLGIWAGHVLVREIEKHSASILLPAFSFAILGIGLLVSTFFTSSLILSAPMGIIGITALWDTYEFFRQEKRIKHGHAPANPRNPRHIKILKAHTTATTLDLLNRNPIGKQVNAEEALQLITLEEHTQ